MTPPQTPGSPEQVWQQTLDQLALQMTRQTFDSWLKNSELVSIEDDRYEVAVASSFAKDWLEHRLYGTVQRTLAQVAGRELQLAFVVCPPPGRNGSDPEPAPAPLASPGPPPQAEETPPVPDDYQPFIIDFRDLGKETGYTALPYYMTEFWEPYLGTRAYMLWLKLISRDRRPIFRQSFTNWTPPEELSFRELARLLAQAGHATLKGRLDRCSRYEDALERGQPLAECCGLHRPYCEIRAEGDERHCFFWRTGLLEILQDEGLVVMQSVRGKTRNHALRFQVWRSLPVLTPVQVARFDEPRQQAHQAWLNMVARSRPQLGLTLARWQAIPLTVQSLVPEFPAYEQREIRERLELNPFRQRGEI